MPIITGTNGDDWLFGTAGPDVINALGGDDYVAVGSEDEPYDGPDIIDGGDGTDTLQLLHGLAAAATYVFSIADNLTGFVNLPDGSQIRGFERIFNFVVPAGGNGIITGGNLSDSIIGGNGNDVLRGLAGNDYLGSDVGIDQLYGGDGDDNIGSNGIGGILDGGAGFDILNLGRTSGADIVLDVADLVGSGSVTLADGTILTSFESVFRIATGAGNDVIIGDNGNQIFETGTGTDTVDGGGGSDSITSLGTGGSLIGGAGSDTLYLDRSSMTGSVVFNVSTDLAGPFVFADGTRIEGFETLDFLATGSGNDRLTGSMRSDSLSAGGGDDVLDGGGGTFDFLNGGTGYDTLTFAAATGGVTVSLGNGRAIGSGISQYLSSIENVVGTSFDDNFTSGLGASGLDGMGGNDVITHIGAGGVLAGGSGTDRLLLYRYTGPGVTLSLVDNLAGVVTLADGTQISGFERLTFLGGRGIDSVNDHIVGGALADTIAGGGGTDIIDGGAGDDTLSQSGSGGVIDGGLGNDVLTIIREAPLSNNFSVDDNLAGVVTLTDGTQITGIERVNFYSTFGANSRDDIITGGALADYISGGGGLDVLDGSGGNDTIVYSGAGGLLTGGSGTDSLVLVGPRPGMAFNIADNLAGIVTLSDGTRVGGFESLQFGVSDAMANGNDVVTGGALGDSLYGNGGTDMLSGLGGTDFIQSSGVGGVFDGGSDDDVLILTRLGMAVDFTFGNNIGGSVILADGTSFTGFEILHFTSGTGAQSTNDRIVIGNVASQFILPRNEIDGGGGTDIIIGGSSYDIIKTSGTGGEFRGGASLDTLVIDRRHMTTAITFSIQDNIFGTVVLPDGTIISEFEAVEFHGGSGNDVITGDSLPDIIAGGEGDDLLEGGFGGFPDYDILDYRTAASAVYLDVENGLATGGAGNDRFSGFEEYYLSAFDDIITVAVEVDAGAGNDLVGGFFSADAYLRGGSGIDTLTYVLSEGGVQVSLALQSVFTQPAGIIEGFEDLTGSQFDDVLVGDSGANTLNGLSGDDNIDGGAGDDLVYGSEGIDVLAGGSGIDAVFGEQGDDIVSGGGGQDKVDGGAGNDIVSGGADGDNLRGGEGDDVLDGGAGSDAMNGGTGIDIFTGGEGRDKFRFGDGDTGNTMATADRITDLDQGQGERISLTLMDAIVGGADDAFTFIGTAAFGNVAGQLRYELIGGNTYVMGDTDGDGLSDFMIRVDGAVVLTGADFSL